MCIEKRAVQEAQQQPTSANPFPLPYIFLFRFPFFKNTTKINEKYNAYGYHMCKNSDS